ncbi:hypothetical protein D3C78_1608200 [compost metagenome]
MRLDAASQQDPGRWRAVDSLYIGGRLTLPVGAGQQIGASLVAGCACADVADDIAVELVQCQAVVARASIPDTDHHRPLVQVYKGRGIQGIAIG